MEDPASPSACLSYTVAVTGLTLSVGEEFGFLFSFWATGSFGFLKTFYFVSVLG